MSDGDVFIYALCEPTNLAIRYVGKAADPERRYADHLFLSRRLVDVHKWRWIESLRRNGWKPVLKILARVPVERWQDEERRWIAGLRAQGCDLTNTMPGGEGAPKGYVPSREAIEKSRLKNLGKIRTPEMRARFSKAQKGIAKPKWTEEQRKKTLETWKRLQAEMSSEERAERSEKRRARFAERRARGLVRRLSESQRIACKKSRYWIYANTPEARLKAARTKQGKQIVESHSGFVGVHLSRRSGRSDRWYAHIKVKNRAYHLGSFESEFEAARTYDVAASAFWGSSAKTNLMRNAE